MDSSPRFSMGQYPKTMKLSPQTWFYIKTIMLILVLIAPVFVYEILLRGIYSDTGSVHYKVNEVPKQMHFKTAIVYYVVVYFIVINLIFMVPMIAEKMKGVNIKSLSTSVQRIVTPIRKKVSDVGRKLNFNRNRVASPRIPSPPPAQPFVPTVPVAVPVSPTM